MNDETQNFSHTTNQSQTALLWTDLFAPQLPQLQLLTTPCLSQLEPCSFAVWKLILTRMAEAAESLRQAYDYWQGQLRSTKLHLHRIVSSSLMKTQNFSHTTNQSQTALLWTDLFAPQLPQLQLLTTPCLSHAVSPCRSLF